MAGLLDFIGLGGGLLNQVGGASNTKPAAKTPYQAMFGIDPAELQREQARRSLMAISSGLLSGNNWNEGAANAMQGIAGAKSGAEDAMFRKGMLGLEYQRLQKSLEPEPGWETLSPNDAAAIGLPPDRVWQRSPSGEVKEAYKPDKPEETKPIFQKFLAPEGVEIPRVSYDGGYSWQDMTTGGGQPQAGGMDPMSAIIGMESGGNPNAIGPATRTNITPMEGAGRAYGLTQMLSPTFNAMADQVGLPPQLRNQFDRRQSETMGRRYYNSQEEEFGGDQVLAAGAYHAGPGNMKAYLTKAGYRPGMSYDQLIANMETFAPKTAAYMREFIGRTGGQAGTDYQMYAKPSDRQQQSGPFAGNSTQSSALNLIYDYQNRSRRGEPISPEDTTAYHIAIAQTSQLISDPVSGEQFIFSPVTQQAVRLDASGNPVGQPFAYNGGQPEQPQGQVGLSGRDIPGRSGTFDESSTVIEAAGEGTGFVAGLARWYQGSIGQIPGAPQADETVAASNAIRIINQNLKQALVNNPRFPVAEQEVVSRMLPDPDSLFTNPADQQNKLRQLHEYIKTKVAQNNRALSTRISLERRRELMDQNADMESVVNMLQSMPIIGQAGGPDQPDVLKFDDSGELLRGSIRG